jgi:hypothetical protein
MTDDCKHLEELLADGGPRAVQNDERATAHVANCEECMRLARALREVDALVSLLRSIEPPSALVEATLAAVLGQAKSRAAAVSTGPMTAIRDSGGPKDNPFGWLAAALRFFVKRPLVAGAALVSLLFLATFTTVVLQGPDSEVQTPPALALVELTGGSDDFDSTVANRPVNHLGEGRFGNEAPEPVALELPMDGDGGLDGYFEQRGRDLEPYPATEFEDDDGEFEIAAASRRESQRDPTPDQWTGNNFEINAQERYIVQLDSSRLGHTATGPTTPSADPPDARLLGVGRSHGGEIQGWGDEDLPGLLPTHQELSMAAQWLAARQHLDGLTFQEATGYWSNTYVPGDPAVRELQRRLMMNDTLDIDAETMSGMSLATNASVNSQPFDSPTHSALAVYMHADRRGVQGPSRVLLQVGLRGTDRQTGRRPPMNIGVVVDLSQELTQHDQASLRALLETLAEMSDIGDRFSLIVAGRPGGLVIPPGSFRYGPVSVALHQLLNPDATITAVGETGVTLTLIQALERASSIVGENDEPESPLGTNLVLLVTSGHFGSDYQRIETWAYGNAVAGIPTSVVGLGDRVDLEQLDRVTLAGQGNRRLLNSAEDAMALVVNELTASSRVVARAVRLRIRLSPGVRLVEILGSHRLDEIASERVRQSEQSIDQRLLRDYGIEADRGDDEEGIQIIIPAFYAGDSQVILLDCVVPGPGPVADVTVRYKDLVHLGNGVARDNLTLSRRPNNPSPLERNVLKNQLAQEFSETLRVAGELVEQGRGQEAVALITRFVSLLRGLQSELPEFERDPEVDNDITIATNYLAVIDSWMVEEAELLGAPAAAAPSAARRARRRQREVSDSLNYSGYRRNMAETQLELE